MDTDADGDRVLRAEGRSTSSRRPATPARSPSRCPRTPEEHVRLQARSVPDRRRAERPDRRRRALLLAVQQPARRRPADDHRQAHRRRLRLELDLRQPHGRRHACGCCRRAASSRRPRSTPTCCCSPAAAGITPVMSITRTALAEGHRQDRAVLRQPRRAVGDLRRASSAELSARVPRPAAGRALARESVQGLPDPGAAEGVRADRTRRTTRSSAARRRS